MINEKILIENGLKGKTLYESSSGTTGNITLSDSVNNYKYIAIEYKNSNFNCCQQVAKFAVNLFDEFIPLSLIFLNGQTIQLRYENLSISGKKITRSGNYAYAFTNGVIETLSSDKPANIYKVVGYK